MKNLIIPFLIFFLIVTSCKTRKQENTLNYMQNIEQIASDISIKNYKPTIQSGDQLIIVFSAKDNDVVRPFNQIYSSSEIIQNPIISGNSASSGTVNISGPTYIVDSEGNIDINVLGKINTKGKTIDELKEVLYDKMTYYVKNPTVNIRLANFKVTVLGEVLRPSEYTITDGQTTLLKALGLAGDLTMYGRRDNVLIVRNENGQLTKEIVNLTDANFFNSPFYNLKQGDVIYVSANENKELTSKTNPNLGLYISIASVSLTAIAVIYGILKN